MGGMLRVGLTGGIASGKSAVADRLARHGAIIIDADVLAREVVEPGTPGLAAIVERFGAPMLHPDGTLNRAALGATVFADAGARADLNRIVHPAVRRRAAELERAAPVDAIVVHVIPLLVETGQARSFDVLVVTDADPDIQLARLASRNGLSRPEAEARLNAQASREERSAVADELIDNTGSLASLDAQVDALWTRLQARATVPLVEP
mgnify:CR=1 FL=1